MPTNHFPSSEVTAITDETILVNEINLYPNPAVTNSTFTLAVDGVENENVLVNIVSVTGQIINTENFILTVAGDVALKSPDAHRNVFGGHNF